MSPLRIGNVTPAEALESAKTRGVVLPDLYYGRLQGVERAYAFSIAGITSLDQLQQALDSLAEAIQKGANFRQWQEQIIDAPAVLNLPRHRLDNIFRTNIQGAYARGKCVHIEQNKTARPYLLYSAINDSRTRPAHLAMNGHIARHDDPIWKAWTPPCGYRCRCTVISLSESQAEKRRKKDDERLTNDHEARDARLKALMVGPDRGWDYSPCDTVTVDGFKLPEELSKVFSERRTRYGPTLLKRLEIMIVAAATMLKDAEDTE